MNYFRKSRNSIPALAIAVYFLIAASSAEADAIFVSGDVSGIWDADTVVVTDSIYVSSGNTSVRPLCKGLTD